jgi:hypothetical protein
MGKAGSATLHIVWLDKNSFYPWFHEYAREKVEENPQADAYGQSGKRMVKDRKKDKSSTKTCKDHKDALATSTE